MQASLTSATSVLEQLDLDDSMGPMLVGHLGKGSHADSPACIILNMSARAYSSGVFVYPVEAFVVRDGSSLIMKSCGAAPEVLGMSPELCPAHVMAVACKYYQHDMCCNIA